MKSSTSRRSASTSAAAALLGLAALVAFAPAFADGAPAKQKTTGSHIAREQKAGNDATRLEQVEVMIGAVRDARSLAREAREEASAAPNLPVLDGSAFLDEANTEQQPR